MPPATSAPPATQASATTSAAPGTRRNGGVLQLARQEQVVRAALADDDGGAGAVDVLVGPARRVVAHEVGALDQEVGVGERDLGAAQRVDGEEADVGRAAGDGVDRLRRGGKLDQSRAARPAARPARCARSTDTPRGAAGGRVGAGQDRVAEVDRGAQPARRARAGRRWRRRAWNALLIGAFSIASVRASCVVLNLWRARKVINGAPGALAAGIARSGPRRRTVRNRPAADDRLSSPNDTTKARHDPSPVEPLSCPAPACCSAAASPRWRRPAAAPAPPRRRASSTSRSR